MDYTGRSANTNTNRPAGMHQPDQPSDPRKNRHATKQTWTRCSNENATNTKLKKITVLSEQFERIEIQPTTLNGLKIQVARAKPSHLQIWHLGKYKREGHGAVIFYRGGTLQSKSRLNNRWITLWPATPPLLIPTGNRVDERAFYRIVPTPTTNSTSQPIKQN